MIKFFNSKGWMLRTWPDRCTFVTRRGIGSEIILVKNQHGAIIAAVGLGSGGWIEGDYDGIQS